MKTLNTRQRDLLGAFLTEPTLAGLQTLLSELSLQQRCDFLALAQSSQSKLQQSLPDRLDLRLRHPRWADRTRCRLATAQPKAVLDWYRRRQNRLLPVPPRRRA
jgi:hypothetical protein